LTRLRRILRGILGRTARGRSTHLLVAIGLIFVWLAFRDPNYFRIDNVRVVALNSSAVAIASVGMAYLMIAGGIDLSIGSIFVAAGFVAGDLSLHTNTVVAFIAGLAVAGALGFVNGLLVWRIRVSPIIVTLGTLTLILGVVTVISNGQGVYGFPQSFLNIGQATPLGVSTMIWVTLGLAIVAAIVLSQTTIGAHIYALGGNREASELAGVRVRRLTLGLFVFAGLLAGLAGILTTARFSVADISFSVDYNLEVITAVILGGVAFTGGEGTIGGVILAVVFLNVVSSGLIASGVNPYYSDVISGAALVISVGLEQLTQERNDRVRRSIALAEMMAAEGGGDQGSGRGAAEPAGRRSFPALAPWRNR
jgi:ribose/xylose/arabinose/galactoside ABC-type transport system permease subunit